MDNQIDKKYWQFLKKFRIMFSLFCFFTIFFFFNLYATPVASAAGYIVNSTDDPGDGICTPDHCTLHEAIASANSNPGKDQISFKILGDAPFTIHLTMGLPVISDPLVIDGSTQPGFAGSPVIELDGSQLDGVNGLEITGGSSLIRSLVINGVRDASYGISIHGMGDNTIQGCYIGTDITGTEAVTNSVVYDPQVGEDLPSSGIGILSSSNNLIGGSQPGEGNLLSGNLRGISIVLSSGNSILGNYVGTDINGTNVIGNGLWFLYKGEYVVYDSYTGINIAEADKTLVGGTQPGARNLISGNRSGIQISDSRNFEILGNYIGTDIGGVLELGNNSEGIFIWGLSGGDLGQSFIGGSSPGAGNLISGNGSGIAIFTEPGLAINGLNIVGNKIGTDYTGTYSIPNKSSTGAVYLSHYSHLEMGIKIGGDQPGEGNLISGNEGPGISVATAEGVIIKGNIIGTDITGSLPLGNSTGIALLSGASDNLIGGVTSGASNLISGNEKYGIYIQGNQNRVYNNRIGTDYLGGSAISNGFDGVIILDGEDNQIGGMSPGEGNLISSNQRAGVFLSGSGSMLNAVQGNQIGTDLAGNANLGNLYGVIVEGGTFNLIGGYEIDAPNRIAFSGQHGVWIKAGYGNSIISNQIFGSAGMGIELDEDGVTLNDFDDLDTGANELQNYPLLTSVESSVIGTTIVGEIKSEPEGWYVLQFFTNESCNPSGHGEGENFLVSSSVLTDEFGYASFTINLPEVVSVGGFLTATATSPTFDTSEFSACVPVVWANSPPIADANGPYSGNEGSFIGLDATGSSDPDGDQLVYSWSIDSPLCSFSDATSPTPNLRCTDNGNFVATVVVDDGLETVSASANVEVLNIPPEIGSFSVNLTLAQVGTLIEIDADFFDYGESDTHTAEWNWGDGTTSPPSKFTQEPGSGEAFGEHTYDAPGVYTITLTVTDDDGGAGQSLFQYVVIYDPSAGFVSGGGWIDSPAGAYTPDPSLIGKAIFGFVSKYMKGADVPTGNTDFQFHAGDLDFHSSSYQWLVVTGNNFAKFKGTGTINGEGKYKFQIWAGDNEPDTFRIKIWYEDGDTEVVVYDNGMDQEIGGGSIVIHTKNK